MLNSKKSYISNMSRFFYFEIHRAPSELLLPSAKKICPERLNWPGRLAGISEGARRISKKKSRPFFIIIFKLKNGNFKARDFIHLLKEF